MMTPAHTAYTSIAWCDLSEEERAPLRMAVALGLTLQFRHHSFDYWTDDPLPDLDAERYAHLIYRIKPEDVE
jgi:hypothetical protein